MTRVLITGGCGFVGANLAPILLREGHEVVIYDNFSRGSKFYLDNVSKYSIINGDIRDKSSLLSAFENVEVIIHLAAYGSVVESVKNPIENYSINAEGTFNVLNAAREAGVKKFIFASTGGALIGNSLAAVNEQSVPRPISPYGASKLAGEGYCCAFANSYDMSITALRFANVVGPISWHKKGVITNFFKAIIENKPLQIFGDGKATRDFLYVQDLCEGLLSALTKIKVGYNVYHLASGKEYSIKEIADLACNVSGSNYSKVIYHPTRKGEVERNCGDFRLAQKQIGFKPQVPIDEAMKRTWEWFKSFSTLKK